MAKERKSGMGWLQGVFMETLGVSEGMALACSVLVVLIVAAALTFFFYEAPPTALTISAGPAGSSFESNAVKYARFLAESGVQLKILNSQGAQENLARLEDPKQRVDVAFVQSGITNTGMSGKTNKIVSLGSMSFQPLLVFYRGTNRALLSQFKGGRIVLGPPGSGTRTLGLALLELNGLDSNSVTLVDLDSVSAAQALRQGSIDALFLMGDSASPLVIRTLLRDSNIQLFDFTQADGYTRRLTYLNKLELPRGVIDFGRDVPNHDITLLGPGVEILASSKLHPALSDLLLEATRENFGDAGLFRRQNEFPSPIVHNFPISPDAERWHKSGKSFTYRYLPFRLASLVNRIVVAFLPALVVLIPGLKAIPALFRIRMRFRLYRWYRALLTVERELISRHQPEARADLARRLDHIDHAINQMKVPVSFADQFYVLRQNIVFVRNRLNTHTHPPKAP